MTSNMPPHVRREVEVAQDRSHRPLGQLRLAAPQLLHDARLEIFEDSGVPHTLEHLIFLGSDLYPFKGVLDTSPTALSPAAPTLGPPTTTPLTRSPTAGSDGFLRMLPVYLDHVFFPTLTKGGFVTEVYHVDGKGHDAGVVFQRDAGP